MAQQPAGGPGHVEDPVPGASITEKDLASGNRTIIPPGWERQEITAAMQNMAADVEELTKACAKPPVELLAQWLALRYVAASRSLQEPTGDPGS